MLDAMARLVVIGGGAAGMSAASAARRVDPHLEVVVCETGGYAAYGMCGIPYFLGGVVAQAEDLLAYPPEVFRERRNIDLRLHTRVTGIDTRARRVGLADGGSLRYDTLVVATGAEPVRPPVPGLDHRRVFTVRSLDEAVVLRRLLDSGTIRRALVVGAGYIGLETAEALVDAGATVTIAEALPRVLPTVDEPVAELVAAELSRHTELRLASRLDAVRDVAGGLTAVVGGVGLDVDVVVIAAGVRPATDLLRAAGARHLPDGAVAVDEQMRTSLPGVLAAGDCVALQHQVLGTPTWVPLGPAANKTGRVAGTVAAGGAATFGGVVGTAVVKVFDLEVARTGLGLDEARAAGLDAVATDVESRTRAKYYPGTAPLRVRVVHTPSGRLLGAQLAGREGAAQRVDVFAAALHGHMSVDDVAALDLAYAPPFAPVYDPVLVAAGRAATRPSQGVAI